MSLICIFSAVSYVHAQYYDEKTQLISLDIKGMEIRDVLKILSDKSGLNIVADKDVEGKVEIYLNDVDVMEALEIVVLTNGLAYKQDGMLIRVMRDSKYEELYGARFKDTTRTNIVRLNYARASAVAKAIGSMKSSIGKVIAYDPSNILILIDNPYNIGQMKGAIREMDVQSLAGKGLSSDYADAEGTSQQPKREINFDEKKTAGEDKVREKKVVSLEPSPQEAVIKPEAKKKGKGRQRPAWTPLFKAASTKEGNLGKAKRPKASKAAYNKKTPYEEYYLTIRREIDSVKRWQDTAGLKGEVELQFTLDREGFLVRGPIVLNKPDLALVRAAVNCVKESVPFPAFPKGMKKKEAEFYVVVRYE